MLKSNRITPNLADQGLGSEGEDCSQRHRKPPKRAGEDEDGADAVLFFERGVSAMGAQKVAAIELAMSESHLADHIRGERTIAFHRIVRICRRNQEAALVIIGELARIAGLAAPRRPRRVDKRDVERQLTIELRRLAPVFELLRKEAAAKLGTDADGIDDALDEKTGERRFDGGDK